MAKRSAAKLMSCATVTETGAASVNAALVETDFLAGMRYFARQGGAMTRKQAIVLALVAIVAAAGGLLLARVMLDQPQTPTLAKATLLQPARPLPPMAFVDQQGRPFGNDQLRGHWSILFFGFTNCPDVCPTTLALLSQVQKQLADLPEKDRPHITLVSVD